MSREIAFTHSLRDPRPLPLDPDGPEGPAVASNASTRLPHPSEPVRHVRPGAIRDGHFPAPVEGEVRFVGQESEQVHRDGRWHYTANGLPVGPWANHPSQTPAATEERAA